jgi:acetyl esterase/lipase
VERDPFHSHVDPEVAAFNSELERLLATYPRVDTLEPTVARAEREAGRSIFGAFVFSDQAEERIVSLRSGERRIRIFPAEEPRAVYLHIHGGGWTLGGVHHQDPRLSELSRACSATVVSIDYRLAPENPYPAAPDDCEAAALWLAEHASEFGSDRMLIGGESAGAHLTVVTLLRLRDRHRLTPFAAANLIYGAFDLRGTPSVRNWGDRLLVLNTPIIEWFTDNFVPKDRRDDPDVSPLLADLTGLPPALFTVGTEDPLLDDSLFMYERWRAAGNAAELALYPGAAHAFDGFPLAIGEEARRRTYEFMGAIIAT